MKLEEVKTYQQLRRLLEEATWQRFEDIVGKIFELHEYEIEVGKVITFAHTKRQYDVIAKQNRKLIVTDCKKWDNRRRITYGLKKAVEDQIERVAKLPHRKEKYPMLVLSCQSPTTYYHQVPIVPVFKLNTFLLNFPTNKERLLRV